MHSPSRRNEETAEAEIGPIESNNPIPLQNLHTAVKLIELKYPEYSSPTSADTSPEESPLMADRSPPFQRKINMKSPFGSPVTSKILRLGFRRDSLISIGNSNPGSVTQSRQVTPRSSVTEIPIPTTPEEAVSMLHTRHEPCALQNKIICMCPTGVLCRHRYSHLCGLFFHRLLATSLRR